MFGGASAPPFIEAATFIFHLARSLWRLAGHLPRPSLKHRAFLIAISPICAFGGASAPPFIEAVVYTLRVKWRIKSLAGHLPRPSLKQYSDIGADKGNPSLAGHLPRPSLKPFVRCQYF